MDYCTNDGPEMSVNESSIGVVMSEILTITDMILL